MLCHECIEIYKMGTSTGKKGRKQKGKKIKREEDKRGVSLLTWWRRIELHRLIRVIASSTNASQFFGFPLKHSTQGGIKFDLERALLFTSIYHNFNQAKSTNFQQVELHVLSLAYPCAMRYNKHYAPLPSLYIPNPPLGQAGRYIQRLRQNFRPL